MYSVLYTRPSPRDTRRLSPTRDGEGAFGRGTGRGGQRDPPPPTPPRRPVAHPPSRALGLDSSPLAVGACPVAGVRPLPPAHELVAASRRARTTPAPRPHAKRSLCPPPPSVRLIPIVRRPPSGHGTDEASAPTLFEHPSHHARGGAGERTGSHRSPHGVRSCAQRRDRRGWPTGLATRLYHFKTLRDGFSPSPTPPFQSPPPFSDVAPIHSLPFPVSTGPLASKGP